MPRIRLPPVNAFAAGATATILGPATIPQSNEPAEYLVKFRLELTERFSAGHGLA